jgi:hypothetical protein
MEMDKQPNAFLVCARSINRIFVCILLCVALLIGQSKITANPSSPVNREIKQTVDQPVRTINSAVKTTLRTYSGVEQSNRVTEQEKYQLLDATKDARHATDLAKETQSRADGQAQFLIAIIYLLISMIPLGTILLFVFKAYCNKIIGNRVQKRWEKFLEKKYTPSHIKEQKQIEQTRDGIINVLGDITSSLLSTIMNNCTLTDEEKKQVTSKIWVNIYGLHLKVADLAENAAQALGAMGSKATTAIPALLDALDYWGERNNTDMGILMRETIRIIQDSSKNICFPHTNIGSPTSSFSHKDEPPQERVSHSIWRLFRGRK